MIEKTKITFVVPETLQKEMRQRLVSDGYSLKDKSKWVSESITNFLAMESYKELVKLGDEMRGFEKTESIVIDKELKKVLDDAVLHIREKYPLLEGLQSRIIRTSVIQKLIKY